MQDEQGPSEVAHQGPGLSHRRKAGPQGQRNERAGDRREPPKDRIRLIVYGSKDGGPNGNVRPSPFADFAVSLSGGHPGGRHGPGGPRTEDILQAARTGLADPLLWVGLEAAEVIGETEAGERSRCAVEDVDGPTVDGLEGLVRAEEVEASVQAEDHRDGLAGEFAAHHVETPCRALEPVGERITRLGDEGLLGRALFVGGLLKRRFDAGGRRRRPHPGQFGLEKERKARLVDVVAGETQTGSGIRNVDLTVLDLDRRVDGLTGTHHLPPDRLTFVDLGGEITAALRDELHREPVLTWFDLQLIIDIPALIHPAADIRTRHRRGHEDHEARRKFGIAWQEDHWPLGLVRRFTQSGDEHENSQQGESAVHGFNNAPPPPRVSIRYKLITGCFSLKISLRNYF